MPAGIPKVEISFLVNADGILVVKAKELRSGTEQSVEVKPQYGLSDKDVEKMLLDSIAHAKEDMQTRALVEAQTEAKQLIETTQLFVNKNASFLTQEETEQTSAAIKELMEALDLSDKDRIQQKIEALNDISRPYAERLMNSAIGKAMSGKNINQAI
jgi:molecular chaperone HscA